MLELAEKQGARVINSPRHLKRLVLALQDNLQKYEAQFGKIDLSGPELKLH